MLNNHIKISSIISILLIIAGLVFMFSSISFGTALGDSWLQEQLNKNFEADTSQYNMIVKMYINNFVIIGTVLLSAGFLTAIFSYFASVPFAKRKNN